MRTHDNVRAVSKRRGREELREERFRRRRDDERDGAGGGHRRHRPHHHDPYRAAEDATTGRGRGRRGGPGRWDRDRGSELTDRPTGSPAGTGEPELRNAVRVLHGAVRQIALGGSDAQVEAAVRVLAESQRSLYLILAGEAETTVG